MGRAESGESLRGVSALWRGDSQRPMTERLLTAQEAATHLRVSLRTVRTAIKAGHLAVVRVGRRVLVSPQALARFIQERESPSSNRAGGAEE